MFNIFFSLFLFTTFPFSVDKLIIVRIECVFLLTFNFCDNLPAWYQRLVLILGIIRCFCNCATLYWNFVREHVRTENAIYKVYRFVNLLFLKLQKPVLIGIVGCCHSSYYVFWSNKWFMSKILTIPIFWLSKMGILFFVEMKLTRLIADYHAFFLLNVIKLFLWVFLGISDQSWVLSLTHISFSRYQINSWRWTSCDFLAFIGTGGGWKDITSFTNRSKFLA